MWLIRAAVSLIYGGVIAANVARFGSDIVVACAGNGCKHGRVIAD